MFLKILKTWNLPYYLLSIHKSEQIVHFPKMLIICHLQDNCYLFLNLFSNSFYTALAQMDHLHRLNKIHISVLSNVLDEKNDMGCL